MILIYIYIYINYEYLLLRLHIHTIYDYLYFVWTKQKKLLNQYTENTKWHLRQRIGPAPIWNGWNNNFWTISNVFYYLRKSKGEI